MKKLFLPLFVSFLSFGLLPVNSFAQSLNFDGVDDYVSVPSPYTAFSDEITVEAWINASSMPVGSGIGQGSENVDNMSVNVWLLHSNGGTIVFFVNDNGNWRYATSSTNIVTSTWHHVVGVASATEVAIYIDGVKEATGSGISSGIQSNPGAVVNIGKDVRFASGRFMTGSVDEVRIWNVARTTA